MDDDSRWRLLYIAKLEVELVHAFSFLRDAGIEPVLIKGWAAARNYPADVDRFYSDVDLAVSEADFDRAKKLLRTGPGIKLGIDIHRELRHLDVRPWSDVFRDSQEIELNGSMVRIPSDEDHLRIMAVHWLNDGGQRRDRLWDFYYAVRNRPATFDWDRCLNGAGDVRREWVIAVIGLTHRYLDLDIQGLPFEMKAKDLPPWLISAVEGEWKRGVFIKPLHVVLNSPRELLGQIRKRFPPNPIQATVEMEGVFDDTSRLKYQLAVLIKKTLPAISSVRASRAQRK